MRGHLDYQAATWQLMPFTRCDGVYGLEGHAVQSGHIEHWLGGHARTIHHKGVCDWLQEVAGFPAARHQAEQRHVRRGHVDHQTATWQPMHFTRCDVVYGPLEGHAVQGGHVEHRCGDGLEDTLAHLTVAAGFKKTPAFQMRGIKQSRGSSGESIWITTRVGGHARIRR